METTLSVNPLFAPNAPTLPAVNSPTSALPLPTLLPARRASSAIAFVDGSLAQYQSLTTSIKAGTDVYVLDPRQDEIKQITKVLAGRTGVTSLHILSHGEVGGLTLGALNLDLSDLGTYSSDLQAWAKALTADADILLYGCNVASGSQGQRFVNTLSQMTGADIAASIDLTGNAAQGGNWVLEYATGKIEATSALTAKVLTAYQGVLVAPTVTLSSATALAYTENGSGVLLDSGATVLDNDSTNFNTGKLTVSLTGTRGSDFNSDRLTIQTGNLVSLDGKIVKYSGTTMGTLAGGIGSENLVITLNANATPIATQALLRQIAYSNVSDNLPASSSRTVQISLGDGTATSTSISRAINLTGVNDAPLIGQSLTLYDGKGKPDSSPWLAYQDASLVGSGAATVTTQASGVTFATGQATYAGYSNYKADITPFPPSISTSLKNTNFPVLDRTQGYVLSFVAGLSAEAHANNDRNLDGKDDRAGFSVVVVGDDKKAIELGFWSDRIFAQDDGTTQTNPALEPDSTQANANRTLFTQAESVGFNTTAITAYDLAVLGNTYTLFANGQAILSGNLRDYTAFVPQNITVGPISIKPPSPYAQKNLIFLGDNTPSASATLQLSGVAISTNSALPKLTVNENTPIVIPNLLIADVDAGTSPVTVTLSAPQGKLTLDNKAGGATIGTNGTSSVTLTGALTQINTTLFASGVTYQGNLNVTGIDQLTIKVDDGGATGGAAQSTSKTLGFSLVPGNNAPTLDLNGKVPETGYVADFSPGGGAVNIVDPTNLTVGNVNSLTLASARITITNPRNLGFETLAATTTGTNITAAYDVNLGILTLTGSDTLANYQTVLRTITYNNTAAIPDYTTRTINFTVSDGSLNSRVAVATVILPSTAQVNQFDFTRDGKADLIWRNDPIGKTVIWSMDGFTQTNGVFLPDVDSNWRIAALGDFNGDGGGDLIWRNYVTQEMVSWRMNGTTLADQAYLPSVEFDWQIVGVGDFNGDRRDDLLFRNTVTGENVEWLLNGVTRIDSYYITAVANSNWLVAGVGDFNGDRKADIVWRNETLNQNALWLMNGATILSQSFLPSAPAVWKVAAIGDFNGDGNADLVWRNTATGENAMWLMNGLTISQQDYLPKVADQSWQIAGSGDFDRDGKVDLIWRNYNSSDTVDGGKNAIWAMNGLKTKNTDFTTRVTDFDWDIA